MKTFILLSFVFGLIIFSCANSSMKADTLFDRITIMLGKGAGSVELADFNNDGFADIAVANSIDSSVTILLGKDKGKFTEAPGSPFFANRYPNDIVISNYDDNNIIILFKKPDPQVVGQF